MATICGLKPVSRYMNTVLLVGTKDNPEIKLKRVIPYPTHMHPREFTDWAETEFDLLLESMQPDKVLYKLTAGLKRHDQIFRIYFSLAILHLVAYRKQIEIRHVVPRSLKPSAFGLADGKNIDQYISAIFGPQDRPWNHDIREAASIALLGFK